MRKLAALLALSAATLIAVPALADLPGAPPPASQLITSEQKKLLEQALKLQEARVAELGTISANAKASAAQLEANAKASDKSAQALQDQAKAFRDAKDGADKETRKALEQFADECDAFAKRDKHFVDEMRDAAKILTKQADTADKGIDAHNKQIARIKTLLGK